MCITDASDRSVVPMLHFIQQTHQIGVGDQCSDFRLVDRHVVSWRADRSSDFVLAKAMRGRVAVKSNSCKIQITSLVPERKKVEPVTRRGTRVMLQPRDVTLHPQLNFLCPMLTVQHDLVREMFEVNIIAVPAAVEAKE